MGGRDEARAATGLRSVGDGATGACGACGLQAMTRGGEGGDAAKPARPGGKSKLGPQDARGDHNRRRAAAAGAHQGSKEQAGASLPAGPSAARRHRGDGSRRKLRNRVAAVAAVYETASLKDITRC